MTLRKLMVASAAATLCAPMLATAESDVSVAAAGTASAQANLDFQVIIPSFVFFQVGSPGTTIDLVTFDLATALEEPGSGNPVPGSSTISVDLRTNAPQVRIAASGGNMDDGSGNLIALTDITAAAGGTIPVPDFGADTGLFAPLGGVLNDTWSYSYDNTAVVPAGTYGGALNGGRVTYTAADF